MLEKAKVVVGKWAKVLMETAEGDERKIGIAMLLLLTDLVETGKILEYYEAMKEVVDDVSNAFEEVKKYFEEVKE